MIRARLSLLTGLVLLACDRTTPARAPSADPLASTTLATLDREACPQLLTRTFPLQTAGATSGELWVRQCATHVSDGALDVEVAILGWQWVGQGSWGFSVNEYAYFRASVRARIHAAIEVEGVEPKLRVWSNEPP